MSNLTQLKAQINAIAQQATTTAIQLDQLSKQLTNQIAHVSATIGGTATGEDKNMIAAFQQADASVKQATAAMQLAASKAKDWISKA